MMGPRKQFAGVMWENAKVRVSEVAKETDIQWGGGGAGVFAQSSRLIGWMTLGELLHFSERQSSLCRKVTMHALLPYSV